MNCRYYLLLRPAVPGAVPKENLVSIQNYDRRQFSPSAGREVWGYAEYSQPLSDKDVSDYDLMVGGMA